MRGITIVFLAILFMANAISAQAHTAPPATSGLQQPFDWQTAWGAIDFSGHGHDQLIPSSQLQPKEDIRNIAANFGTQTTDLTSLKAYTLDVNADGKTDFVLDGNGFFPQYQDPNAPNKICTAVDGCYLSIYIKAEDTNLITAPAHGQPSCPATPELNISCNQSCAATVDNCPANFRYNTHTAFDEQVISWNFITAETFRDWARGKSYTMYNERPVFAAVRNNTNCYNAELASNNNQCIKYYQYFGDENSGRFVDLYSYSGNVNANGDYNPRWTYNSFNIRDTASGQSYNYDETKRLTPPQPGDNLNYGTGYGLRLAKGGSIDLQFAKFEFTTTIPTETFGFNGQRGYPNKPDFAAFHIENHSANDYFVPVNTNAEFRAFVDSHQREVTVGPEQLQFTAWTGELACPLKVTAPTTIAAQRFCQSSTSDYRPCQACIDAKVPGYEQGCTIVQSCEVNTCYVSQMPGNPSDGRYIGSSVSMDECLQQIQPYLGQNLTGAVGSYPDNYWLLELASHNITWREGRQATPEQCAYLFNFICANGHLCVAADTMVALPDGTEKRIDQIKAGDMVLGFGNPRGALKPYKVAKLAITPNEPMISINGQLKLTPNHMVVTGKGHMLEASKLKVGNTIMLGDRTKLTVKSIEPVETSATVYNLEFKVPGVGFIANGVRVAGYRH